MPVFKPNRSLEQSTLPAKTPSEMEVLPAEEATTYLRNVYGYGRGTAVDDGVVSQIIKKYREGRTYRGIAEDLKLSTQTVKMYLQRAESLHIVRVRRGVETKAEEIAVREIAVRERKLELEGTRAEEDAKLAAAIRKEIWATLAEITPEKRQDAKFKDLVDGLCRLVEKERLISDKSTVNTATHSVIERITRLDSLSMKQQEELIKKRHEPSVESTDG